VPVWLLTVPRPSCILAYAVIETIERLKMYTDQQSPANELMDVALDIAEDIDDVFGSVYPMLEKYKKYVLRDGKLTISDKDLSAPELRALRQARQIEPVKERIQWVLDSLSTASNLMEDLACMCEPTEDDEPSVTR
jgi:hypothetical protein